MEPEPAATEQTASPDVIDDAFAVLRDRDRRYVCYFLLEHGTASVSELADVVTGWRHAPTDGIVEPQCRRQCYLQLRHTHVPKLIEAGVVDHDEDTDTVSLSPCPGPIREFVARACAAETGFGP